MCGLPDLAAFLSCECAFHVVAPSPDCPIGKGKCKKAKEVRRKRETGTSDVVGDVTEALAVGRACLRESFLEGRVM